MNYQNHYCLLIKKYGSLTKPDQYSERHHILPRCLGGSDDGSNLVYLSAEAHYVAHQLLVKMNPDHYGVSYAAMLMTRTGNGKGNGRSKNKHYSWLKERFSRLNGVRMSEHMKTNNPSQLPHVKEMRRQQLLINNPTSDPEVRKLIGIKSGAASRERMSDPLVKKEWVELVTAAKVEQGSYAKQAKSLRYRWADPEFKARQIELIKQGKARKKQGITE